MPVFRFRVRPVFRFRVKGVTRRKTPTIFGVGWWAHVKCKTHPYHPNSTFLGFTAALAPKVSGASLSFSFDPTNLSVRGAVAIFPQG